MSAGERDSSSSVREVGMKWWEWLIVLLVLVLCVAAMYGRALHLS